MISIHDFGMIFKCELFENLLEQYLKVEQPVAMLYWICCVFYMLSVPLSIPY